MTDHNAAIERAAHAIGAPKDEHLLGILRGLVDESNKDIRLQLYEVLGRLARIVERCEEAYVGEDIAGDILAMAREGTSDD